QHPHHQRAEMPARSGQALEHRLLRRLLVEMHRLRIVLRGKGEDLLARHATRAEGTETAGLEIFEGERGHDGDIAEGSPIVAVICSNLNPPTRIAHPSLARSDIRG